jgi:hypothetical protein
MHIDVVRECSAERSDGQRVRKNDEEFNSLVDRINSVIDLLREEAEGRSKASSKQVEKVCQLFYEYVPML